MEIRYQVFNEITFQGPNVYRDVPDHEAVLSGQYRGPGPYTEVIPTSSKLGFNKRGVHVRLQDGQDPQAVADEVFLLKNKFEVFIAGYCLIEESDLTSTFYSNHPGYFERLKEVLTSVRCGFAEIANRSIVFTAQYEIEPITEFNSWEEDNALLYHFCQTKNFPPQPKWILVGADDCLGPYKTQEQAKEVWKRAGAGYFAIKELKTL
jgi:hypothetical protein